MTYRGSRSVHWPLVHRDAPDRTLSDSACGQPPAGAPRRTSGERWKGPPRYAQGAGRGRRESLHVPKHRPQLPYLARPLLRRDRASRTVHTQNTTDQKTMRPRSSRSSCHSCRNPAPRRVLRRSASSMLFSIEWRPSACGQEGGRRGKARDPVVLLRCLPPPIHPEQGVPWAGEEDCWGVVLSFLPRSSGPRGRGRSRAPGARPSAGVPPGSPPELQNSPARTSRRSVGDVSRQPRTTRNHRRIAGPAGCAYLSSIHTYRRIWARRRSVASRRYERVVEARGRHGWRSRVRMAVEPLGLRLDVELTYDPKNCDARRQGPARVRSDA